jgi:hypothetical protein
MKMTRRRISAVVAITCVALSLAACGGSGSGEVVARVAGVGAISKASLEHWIPIEAVVLYQEHPTTPVPKGVIPDPPDYAACIAYLRRTPQKLGEHGASLTTAQLKGKCKAKSRELQILTLNTLITWYWTLGAGKEFRVKTGEGEVKRQVKAFSERFSKKGEYATYLRLTGQTATDMLLRGRVQLVESKISQKLSELQKHPPKGLTAQERGILLAKLAQSLPPGKRWAAMTTCRRGYVVSACKEYRGSLAPGIPN